MSSLSAECGSTPNPAIDGLTSSSDDGPQQPIDDYIVSFAWRQGFLAVSYIQLNTMIIYITEQTADLKPDFPFLNNLCRRLNMSYILTSGPPHFLREVARLAGLPDNLDFRKHNVDRNNNKGNPVFVIYTADEKSRAPHSARIMTLQPVSMPSNLNETDHKIWLGTILPLHQPLVIQALGALLHYFDANGRHITNIPQPLIADLKVYNMKDMVLMDNDTFLALQIFSPSEHHPSAFQMGVARNKEGLSVYSLLNQCCSSYGSHELKSMMLQPTRDCAEIQKRLDIVEWSMCAPNMATVKRLRANLRTMNNISEVYWRLMRPGSRASGWRQLQNTVNAVHAICLICVGETKQTIGVNDAVAFLKELADGEPTFKKLANSINRVLDVVETVRYNRFVVRAGFHDQLDAMKEHLIEMKFELQRIVELEVAHFPDGAQDVTVDYMDTIGFVIVVNLKPSVDKASFRIGAATKNVCYFFEDERSLYFQTPKSTQFNQTYGDMYPKIIALEHEIGQHLLEHILPNVMSTHKIVRMCAQLDCFIAFGRSATTLNLIRPAVIDEKAIYITAGRHVLCDMVRKTFHANDTSISKAQHQLVLVLTAPNASGKSIYLKQVALIAYMTHIGCFVAAKKARVGRLDAIYSRMYSLECTHQGGSAFLNDLQQMGRVLSTSTTHSLVLIDEFGKGTNSTEGQALLIACIEHLLKRGEASPMALISTHFEHVSEMLIPLGWVRELSFRCLITEQGITSTFQLVDGSACGAFAAEGVEVKSSLKELFNITRGEGFEGGIDVGCSKRKVAFAFQLVKDFIQTGPLDAKKIRDRLFKDPEAGTNNISE